MKTLLKATLVVLFLALLYVLVGSTATPTYAQTCQGGTGQCRVTCESDEESAGICTGGLLTCCVPKEEEEPAPTTEGTCPSGTETRRDSAQCSATCSGECTNDSAGERRCCTVFSGSSACPNGATAKSSASQCAQSCEGSCVNDNNGVARCCLQPAGGTTTQGGDLPEKKSVISTPLGDIPTDPAEFAAWILERGIGLGALLAVLFTIIGGFGVATSAGDPDKLEKAKSQITAAVSGLVFLLASALILRIIGRQIIGIDFF